MINIKYQGSKNRHAKQLLPIILKDRKEGQWVYDLFCLEENTNIYTTEGIKPIKNVKIGDFVYNEKGYPVRIINKIESQKEGIEIKINGGINIKCTPEHKFYSSGEEIEAVNLKNKILDVCKFNFRKSHIIDMSKYINISENRFSMNGNYNKDKVRLSHISNKIDRYIELNEDIMYLYGWVLAEGDKRGITLNIKEEYIANKLLSIYEKNILKRKTYTKAIYKSKEEYRKNALNLIFPEYSIYKKIFFEAMNAGYGARNKNLSFLFGLNKNLVKKTLLGLFQGDGCVTVRNNKYYTLNLKTSSKEMAYQLQYLLMSYFNIKSNINYGINKERKIQGRVLKSSDYYNVSICGVSDIEKIAMEMLPVNYYKPNKNRKELKVKEIKKIGLIKTYDITLEDNSSHLFTLDSGIITHNCGGGNIADKIEGNVIANDFNKYVIEALKLIRDDVDVLPENNIIFTEKDYNFIRTNLEFGGIDDGVKGYTGFALSYGGKWFGGWCRDKEGRRDYVAEAYRNAVKQAPNLQNVTFTNLSYDEVPLQPNSILYLDPPYRDTTKYKTGSFDYDKFYQWCIDKHNEGHQVFISEYYMPLPFKKIWEKEVYSSLTKNTGSKKNKEALWIL